MHELLNTRTGGTVAFASDIDELTPGQWLHYIRLLLLCDAGKISIANFKHSLFKSLTGLKISPKIYFYKKEIQEQIWSAIARHVDLMDSFFDIEEKENTLYYMPHWQCGKNLLPTIRLYTGPSDMMQNASWGVFCNCIKALTTFHKTNKDIQADTLPATVDYIFHQLYKPRFRFLKLKVPYHAKYAAFIFFRSVNEILNTYPLTINGEKLNFKILFEKGTSQGKPDKTGWDGLRLSIAQAGVFGALNDTDKQPLWDVLIFLYKSEMERRNNKPNNTANG